MLAADQECKSSVSVRDQTDSECQKAVKDTETNNSVKKQRIKNTGGKAKDTGEELTDKRTADSGCHAGWNDLTGRSESFLSTD